MDSSNFSATNSPSEKVSGSRRSRVWWLLGLLLLGGGGLGVGQVLARREPVSTTAPPPAMPVKTLTLQSRLLQGRSEFIANLRSRRSVTLRPQIQGRVRHPQQSWWLDECARLKGGRSLLRVSVG
jgi:hypothetical protein